MEKKNFRQKNRPAIGLSLFPSLSGSFSSEKNKSPRNFENGVVGLGIVAGMTDLNNRHELFRTAKAISPKSCPIPIVSSSAKAAAYFRGGSSLEKEYQGGDEVDELSESYTCVISHVENKLIKKQVYFGDDKVNMTDEIVRFGIFSASPLNVGGGAADLHEFSVADFLSSCYLCSKHLHGRDIFMYRGEKAFCSSECRDKQIRSDDYREKCGSKKAMNYSVSPCSGPLLFSTGLVAA